MEEIGKVVQWQFQLFGVTLTVNIVTLIMSWIVCGVLALFTFLATIKIKFVPGVFQSLAETIIAIFDNLVADSLESKDRKYFPFITTIFLFIILSNYMGVFPGGEEPTKDLNTPLGLGILGFVVAHYSGIRVKGLKTYILEYMQPFFIMAPLNIIGELAKIVSISFRLFGNIMGGSIIIIVISSLVHNLVLPPFLNAYFGIFAGTVQAFVFTMLSLVYIALQIKG